MPSIRNLAPGRQLTPKDLSEVGEALFGRWGWQTRLAEALEVDGSTVRRWVSGAIPIPHPIKHALRLMLENAALRENLTPPAPEKRPGKPRSRR
ncbi:MAG: hypothetical protein ABL883_03770 [Terricaulis sp.]